MSSIDAHGTYRTAPPWRLLNGDPVPAAMRFVEEPPSAIGEVIGGWTNNGPTGHRIDAEIDRRTRSFAAPHHPLSTDD